ncbi:MAG: hypothetical protein HY842_07950 [Bacteroidetes bacterium]|nr:hypothetical protein [Bacteroidota bacterium]
MKNSTFISLTVCCFLFGCGQPQKSSKIENAKQALLKFAKEQKIEASFNFDVSETDSLLTAVLINKTISNQVRLGSRDTNILIGLHSLNAKDANSSSIFKTYLIKRGSQISVEISDLTGIIVEKIPSHGPIDDIHTNPHSGGFDDIQDCMDDFYRNKYCDLLDQANQSCKTVYYGFLCCLKNGARFFIDFIAIKPTAPWCRFNIVASYIPIVVVEKQ